MTPSSAIRVAALAISKPTVQTPALAGLAAQDATTAIARDTSPVTVALIWPRVAVVSVVAAVAAMEEAAQAASSATNATDTTISPVIASRKSLT